MGTTLLLLVLATLAVAGIVGTFVLVFRDGYRRVPRDPARARARASSAAPATAPGTAAAVSARGSRTRDGMPRAAATRIHST